MAESVELFKPRHEEDSLQRGFVERNTDTEGVIVFANGQEASPFEVQVVFHEPQTLPSQSAEFPTRVDAIEGLFDDKAAGRLVTSSIISAVNDGKVTTGGGRMV